MTSEGILDGNFPPDFVWGAATSAYQIEGSPRAGGKGESIWDRFCSMPGRISDGSSGDVACDHYRLWREDIALMRELGLGAYRFSVSWPRIIPEGRGKVAQAGLDFYDRLVDGLLAAGITPFVTLYHWDLPQALQDRGGWGNRDTAYAFADYAQVVARRLGDRVPAWITHNEPWVAAFLGNLTGEHAPGLRDLRSALRVTHTLLVSHGLAVRAVRATSPAAQVGITLNLAPAHPAGDSQADLDAATRQDGYQNRIFLDPIFKGHYPDDMVELFGDRMPEIRDGDLALISTPVDFLGVNYYFRVLVRDSPKSAPIYVEEVKPHGAEYTEMNWEVYPDGLRELLVRLHSDYAAPAYYVTENGCALPDVLMPDGRVSDPRRVAYLESHLDAAGQAISAGVPLKGYFAWSLMDNFEWAWGYTKRFGLVFVDYNTQARVLKESALAYRRIISEHSTR